ncbi:DUF3332 family protein [bacterium]|nr:DUF3332 family protein [bacterium]
MKPGHGILQTLAQSRRARTAFAALAAVTLLGTLPGCYGRFPLTNSVYRWNGRVTDNHIVNSIIMIVLAIIPVYGICILVDAIIINSIEFWDGKEIDISKSYDQPDGTRVELARGDAPNKAILTLYRGDDVLAQRHFTRDEAGVTTVTNEEGAVVSHVTPDGNHGFLFTDATGNPTGSLTADQIAELRENASAEPLLNAAALPANGG